jgi:hypothetical protein
MIAPEPSRFGTGNRFSIDRKRIVVIDERGGTGDDRAVQHHAASLDQALGIATRSDAGAGQELSDPFLRDRWRGRFISRGRQDSPRK